jgi:hypothetical protein
MPRRTEATNPYLNAVDRCTVGDIMDVVVPISPPQQIHIGNIMNLGAIKRPQTCIKEKLNDKHYLKAKRK